MKNIKKTILTTLIVAAITGLPIHGYAQNYEIQQIISFSKANGNTFRILEEKIYVICSKCPVISKLSPPPVLASPVKVEEMKGGANNKTEK